MCCLSGECNPSCTHARKGCLSTIVLTRWLCACSIKELEVIQGQGLSGLCDRPPKISIPKRCRCDTHPHGCKVYATLSSRWCSRARKTAHPLRRLLGAPELRAYDAVSSVPQLLSQISVVQQRVQGPDPSFAERADHSHRDNGWSAVHECHYEVRSN